MAMSMADIEAQMPPAEVVEPRPTDMMGGIGALPVEVMREEEVMTGGIGDIQSAVEMIRTRGRETDEILAHLSPDEMVIPNEILESNPQIKEMIFAEMRLMGIEEPERYVAGSGLNSINPDTGLPEFFLKNIVKGISNVVKSVGKVIKKAAPVVLPIAFAMTGLGPVYGAALGSGVGTLVQGGDLKDAFKSALIGGAIGGITSGVQAKLGGGTFRGGFEGAFVDPTGRFSQTLANVKAGDPFAAYQAPSFATPAAAPAETTPSTTSQAATAPLRDGPNVAFDSSGNVVDIESLRVPESGPSLYEQTLGKVENVYDQYLSPSRASIMEKVPTLESEIARISAANPEMAPSLVEAAAKANVEKAAPGLIAKYGPLAAAGTAGIAALGGFETPDVEPYDAFAGETRYFDMSPEEQAKYRVGTTRVTRPTDFPYYVPSPYLQYAAQGGAMTSPAFPRRNGAVAGPGTETSDDIPAMLSDGEFVLTAKAVRGAGNGDRQKGVANLYDMMRTFERMA